MRLDSLIRLTVASHPHLQTFPQSAVLASIPVTLVDWTVAPAPTLVPGLLADGSLEESFTSLATDGSVMSS